MALTGRKLAFRVLKSQYAIKSESDIMDAVRQRPFAPLATDKVELDCWVSPKAEIEDEFTEAIDNPGDAEAALLQFLRAEKKANPKVVQRRYQKALATQRRVQRAVAKFGFKETPEWRKEIKDQVREEEAKKAPPVYSLAQVCAMIKRQELLIGTKSEKSALRIGQRFFEACSAAPDGTNSDFASALLSLASEQNVLAKMQPFTASKFATSPPQDAHRFAMEFLTWLVLRSLEGDKSDVHAVGWVRLKYIAGEKTASTLKASDESSSPAVFAAEALLEGALVDEVKLQLKGDWFATGKEYTTFKLDSTGYISDLDHQLPGELQKDRPAIILERACGLWDAVMDEAKRFLKLRMEPQKWSKEAGHLRDLAKRAAEE